MSLFYNGQLFLFTMELVNSMKLVSTVSGICRIEVVAARLLLVFEIRRSTPGYENHSRP